MNKSLIGIHLASLWNSVLGRTSRKGKKRSLGLKILIALFAAYVVGALLLSAGMLFYGMASALIPLDLSALYFISAGLICVLLCFIGTIFTVQSQLFQAKDNEILLSLPFRPSAILTSRMIVMLLLDLLYSLLVMVPAGVVYCFFAPVGPLQVTFYLVGILLLTLLGTAISCFFGWLAALLSRRLRHPNLFSTLFMLAFFFLVYAGIYGIQGYFTDLVLHGEELLTALHRAFPPLYAFAVTSLGDAAALLELFLWCALPFTGVCFLLSKSFWKIALSKPSGRRRTQVLREEKAHGIGWALTKKELRRFFSLPGYVLNDSFGAIFSLIMGGAVLIKGRDLLEMISFPDIQSIIPLACAAFLSFCALMNIASSASLSLEGKSFWILRSLPIPEKTILLSKAVCPLMYGLPCILIASACCWIAFPMSFLEGFLLWLVPTCVQLLSALLGTVANIWFPRFDWINETAVIKQGMASLFSTLGGMALMIPPVLLYLQIGSFIAVEAFLAICAGFFLLLSAVCWIYLVTGGVKRLRSLS